MLIYTFIDLSAFLLISCEKEPYFNVGFDSTINEKSNVIVVADISDNVKKIYLNGSISVDEGEVEINLHNPGGVETYERIVTARGDLNIDETFEAKPGEWKLRYLWKEGVGEIDLHIHMSKLG